MVQNDYLYGCLSESKYVAPDNICCHNVKEHVIFTIDGQEYKCKYPLRGKLFGSLFSSIGWFLKKPVVVRYVLNNNKYIVYMETAFDGSFYELGGCGYFRSNDGYKK